MSLQFWRGYASILNVSADKRLALKNKCLRKTRLVRVLRLWEKYKVEGIKY